MLQNWEWERACAHSITHSLVCLLLLTIPLSRRHANTMMLMCWVIRTDRQIDTDASKKNNHSDNLRVLLVCTICVDRRTLMRWDENWLEILINHKTNFMYTNKNNKHITRSPHIVRTNGRSTQTQKNCLIVKSVTTTITLNKMRQRDASRSHAHTSHTHT